MVYVSENVRHGVPCSPSCSVSGHANFVEHCSLARSETGTGRNRAYDELGTDDIKIVVFNSVPDTVMVSCCSLMIKSVTSGGCHDVVIFRRNTDYMTS